MFDVSQQQQQQQQRKRSLVFDHMVEWNGEFSHWKKTGRNKQKQIFLFRFWNMFTEQSPTLQMCVDHMCVCVVDDCSSVANNTMDKKKIFISLKIQPDLFFHFSLFCHCVYWQLSPEQNRKWSFSFCCRIVSVDKLFATIGMPNKYHHYHHHHH